VKSEILYGPSYSLAVLSLSSGETIQAESGAMVSMTEGIEMQTSTKGGALKGLKRAVLGGESLFINTFTAERDAGITMAPAFPWRTRRGCSRLSRDLTRRATQIRAARVWDSRSHARLREPKAAT